MLTHHCWLQFFQIWGATSTPSRGTCYIPEPEPEPEPEPIVVTMYETQSAKRLARQGALVLALDLALPISQAAVVNASFSHELIQVLAVHHMYVHPGRIRLLNIRAGSIVIVFAILPQPGTADWSEQFALLDLLQSLCHSFHKWHSNTTTISTIVPTSCVTRMALPDRNWKRPGCAQVWASLRFVQGTCPGGGFLPNGTDCRLQCAHGFYGPGSKAFCSSSGMLVWTRGICRSVPTHVVVYSTPQSSGLYRLDPILHDDQYSWSRGSKARLRWSAANRSWALVLSGFAYAHANATTNIGKSLPPFGVPWQRCKLGSSCGGGTVTVQPLPPGGCFSAKPLRPLGWISNHTALGTCTKSGIFRNGESCSPTCKSPGYIRVGPKPTYTCSGGTILRSSENAVCQDLNDCDANPCHHRAFCVNSAGYGPGTFQCTCKRGWYGNGVDCVVCRTGQIYNASSHNCVECPRGQHDHDAMTAIEHAATPCQQCASGRYTIPNPVQCIECRAGQYDHDQDPATYC
eukprot:COSAG01_NODE_4083_length_5373_cov_13.157945_5_plen_515_part_01